MMFSFETPVCGFPVEYFFSVFYLWMIRIVYKNNVLLYFCVISVYMSKACLWKHISEIINLWIWKYNLAYKRVTYITYIFHQNMTPRVKEMVYENDKKGLFILFIYLTVQAFIC